MGLATGLFSLSVASAAQPAKFDPPDLQKEMEIHRQFVGIVESGPVKELLAPDAYFESYAIQPRETLWSLSQTLYGDGNYWPRIWAQNHGITNPHLIRSGHTLQFLLGSEDDTPAFRFSENGESGIELSNATTKPNGPNAPVIEIPSPEIPPKPLVKVPNSFPEWQSIYKGTASGILDDAALGRRAPPIPSRMQLRAYVQEEPVSPAGYFLEPDREASLPVVNQYVFIKVKKGNGQVGQKMLIVQDGGRLKKVTDGFDDGRDAYMVQVVGELEITETARPDFKRSDDRENYDTFRALVTRTTGLALKDYVLIPGSVETVDISPHGHRAQIVAKMLGSERHPASMLFGQGDFIFLNRGANDGLKPGQILDIFTDRRLRNPDTPVPNSPASSGLVKVVKVTTGLATAFVLEARDGLNQGDEVKESQGQAQAEILDSELPELEPDSGLDSDLNEEL